MVSEDELAGLDVARRHQAPPPLVRPRVYAVRGLRRRRRHPKFLEVQKQFSHNLSSMIKSYLLVAWDQPEPRGSVLYPNNEHKCRGLRKPGTWTGAACVSPYMPPHCHGEEGAMSQVNLASSASHSRSEERKARERGGLNSSIIPFAPIQESMTDLRLHGRAMSAISNSTTLSSLQTTMVY